MAKRVVLFLVTNLAIVLTVSLILNLLGVGRYAGPNGLDLGSLAVFCFVWGMAGSMISLLISRWIAKRSTGMQLVDGNTGNASADWLYRTVEQLTRKANLPMPEVGIYPSEEVNAFATGPSKNRSLVAVSSGLLRSMSQNEVEGVLAHEVSHIANGDMVTMTLLQGVVNAFVMFLARVIAFALANRGSRDDNRGAAPSYMVVWLLEMVLGVIGMIVVAWFSRQREFRADHGGATLAGKADMLAALRRLGANRALIDPHHEALATMKISGRWTGLFSTHPPLEQRIAVLERAQIL
jgi:heat shock protein HtpX